MGVLMYILLCGYPPFYSVHQHNSLTAGMNRRIRAGDYQFDGPEWTEVSSEAKSIIKRMLTVNPTQRITITEIADCSWLPEVASQRPIDMTPLDDVENWNEIQVSRKRRFSFSHSFALIVSRANVSIS